MNSGVKCVDCGEYLICDVVEEAKGKKAAKLKWLPCKCKEEK